MQSCVDPERGATFSGFNGGCTNKFGNEMGFSNLISVSTPHATVIHPWFLSVETLTAGLCKEGTSFSDDIRQAYVCSIMNY